MEPEPVDAGAFKDAMRLLPAGVVMVTVCHEGRPWGLTISSCSSLTIEPAQMVLSLGSRTVTCRRIGQGRRFGIAVLGTEHLELAQIGSASGAPKFIDAFCDPASVEGGAPRVLGALYHLSCEAVATYHHGDHTLVIGEALQARAGRVASTTDPLVYFDRRFRRVGGSLARHRSGSRGIPRDARALGEQYG